MHTLLMSNTETLEAIEGAVPDDMQVVINNDHIIISQKWVKDNNGDYIAAGVKEEMDTITRDIEYYTNHGDDVEEAIRKTVNTVAERVNKAGEKLASYLNFSYTVDFGDPQVSAYKNAEYWEYELSDFTPGSLADFFEVIYVDEDGDKMVTPRGDKEDNFEEIVFKKIISKIEDIFKEGVKTAQEKIEAIPLDLVVKVAKDAAIDPIYSLMDKGELSMYYLVTSNLDHLSYRDPLHTLPRPSSPYPSYLADGDIRTDFQTLLDGNRSHLDFSPAFDFNNDERVSDEYWWQEEIKTPEWVKMTLREFLASIGEESLLDQDTNSKQ